MVDLSHESGPKSVTVWLPLLYYNDAENGDSSRTFDSIMQTNFRLILMITWTNDNVNVIDNET